MIWKLYILYKLSIRHVLISILLSVSLISRMAEFSNHAACLFKLLIVKHGVMQIQSRCLSPS